MSIIDEKSLQGSHRIQSVYSIGPWAKKYSTAHRLLESLNHPPYALSTLRDNEVQLMGYRESRHQQRLLLVMAD